MANLESVLARIPGYGGFLAKSQFNQQQDAGQIQQARSLMQIAQAVQEKQKEQAYRDAVGGLGEAPTQEQLAQLAAKYGSPDVGLRVHQSSLDRQSQAAAQKAASDERAAIARAEQDRRSAESQAQRDQRASEAAAARAQRMEEIKLRLSDQATARAERTDLIKEMQALRQQATQVKPPSGYRPTAAGDLEPIPGGPADTKLTGAFNQDRATLDNTAAALDRLAVAANEVKNAPGLPKATGVMAAVPGVGGFATIPGTDAANFKAKLQTLKAQVGFGVLQEMRNASKTGGALGQVTEKELGFLQNALAALDTAQTPAEFKRALDKVLEYTETAKGRLRNAFNLRHASRVASPGAASPTGAPERSPVDALLEKYK